VLRESRGRKLKQLAATPSLWLSKELQYELSRRVASRVGASTQNRIRPSACHHSNKLCGSQPQ
jgi:hypothetical protein